MYQRTRAHSFVLSPTHGVPQARTGETTARSPFGVAECVVLALAGCTLALSTTGLPGVRVLGLAVLPLLILFAVQAPTRLWASAFSLPVTLFIAFAASSLVWSENRTQTAFSLGALLLEGFAALAAMSFGRDTGIRLVGALLKGALIASAVLALAVPSVGRMTTPGAPWKGLFLHKNALGAVLAFAIVYFAVTERGARRAAWMLAAAGCLAMSNSKGSLVAALVGLGVVGVSRLVYLRRAGKKGVPSLVLYGGFAVIGLAANEYSDRLIALLNRKPDLTDRTEIWSVIVRYGRPHRWFGSGIGAQIYNGSLLEREIEQVRGYVLGTTHNGFLAVYLGLGYVGLAFFAVLLLSILWRIDRFRIAQAGSPDPALLALGLFACYATLNFSEDMLLTRTGWFFLMVGLLQLEHTAVAPQVHTVDTTAGLTSRRLVAAARA